MVVILYLIVLFDLLPEFYYNCGNVSINKEVTMIIIMERNATEENIQTVVDLLELHEFKVLVKQGDVHTVIDALGDKTTLSPGRIEALDGVKQIKFIREPFRLASRDRKPEDTVIEFSNGVKIGGANRPVSMVIYRVIHDLIDQVVQTFGGYAADIHTGTPPDRLKPLQHRNIGSIIITALRHQIT